MAVESGMGMTITVDDQAGPTARNLSADIVSCDWGMPRGTQEVTGVTSTAVLRLLLLADFTITMTGLFDDGSNLAHAVFKTIPTTTTDRTITIVHSGQTLTAECVLSDYAMSRSGDGSLSTTVQGSLSNGTAPTWS